MRWGDFRRSDNVDDYRDPARPVDNRPSLFMTILEMLRLSSSRLAHDAGADDVRKDSA